MNHTPHILHSIYIHDDRHLSNGSVNACSFRIRHLLAVVRCDLGVVLPGTLVEADRAPLHTAILVERTLLGIHLVQRHLNEYYALRLGSGSGISEIFRRKIPGRIFLKLLAS